MVKKRISKKINKIVKKYADRLTKENNLPINKVIVFGSRAKGKANKWSDIDVCIVSPKFKNSLSAIEYLWQRRSDDEVKDGIEPIGFSIKDFQKKKSSLIREIIATGVEI